ncbi:MAG TPA: O-antigen ligase family protein [Bryobacteraceae bacterium]
MALLQAALLALVMLILAPGYFFYFDITPKTVLLFAGVGLILLVDGVRRNRLRYRPPAIFSALVLLQVVSLAISTIVSKRPGLSLFGSNWRSFGTVPQTAIVLFAWLAARTCAGRPERIRTILRGVTLAGILSAAYGILQYAGWDPLLPPAGYHVGEGIWTIVRPPSTLGYASYFATWLLFAAFLALAQYSMENTRVWRCIAACGTGLTTAAMLVTGTRAAILALVAGAIAWASLKGLQVTRRKAALAGLAAAMAAVFFFSPPGLQLRSRVRWFVEDPWGGARPDLWRDSLRMASHKPAAGYGPETFTAEFPRFESVALARSYPDFSHESPHNIFVDSLVSQGIPGLLILIALCGTGLLIAWRLKLAPFAAALTAGIVSQQFTSFTIPTALIFWTTLALLAAQNAQATSGSPRFPFATAEAIAACALLYCAARLGVADHALALAGNALHHEDLRAAAHHYEIYKRYRLSGGSADLWYSRGLLNIALHSNNPLTRTAAMLQSEAAGLQATQTAEDPFNSWYNLAVISGLNNNGSRAEKCLRAAIAANGNWYKPHWTLAQVLAAEGRIGPARREATIAAELDGGKHPEVARILTEVSSRTGTASEELLQK